MAYKGFYRPVNRQKYRGNANRIVYRSGWELKFMRWCDLSDIVIEWQSEEFAIPYRHPLDGQVHRYFPDFKVKLRTKKGIETWVVEIKPHKQAQPPVPRKRKTRKYINEVQTYAINKYKWDYAQRWCQSRGYKFVVLTEHELSV